MRLLVAMASPEQLRFYDETLVELVRRGHDVRLAVETIREGKPVRFDTIRQACPALLVAGLVPPRQDRWAVVARAVRGTLDFIRYWHPDLCGTTLLRGRVKRQALPWTLQWLDWIRSLRPRSVHRIMALGARAERAIPPAAALLRFIDEHEPDLVAVTPLVEPASDQMDLVRAAQTRGVPVAALVASWDNLTNKGDLRADPDAVLVWNEAQKREAVEYHRIPPERVVVTGAQPFDRWFGRNPSATRDQFCRQVGLPVDRPFVLFTGSSIFIARAEHEMPFVRQWIEALRRSGDPLVRDLAVLVRPHPYNGRAWDAGSLAGIPDVAVWPRGGYDPVNEENRSGLFDSLTHCAAVVGINTSAMIEAAIIGRPVLSVQTPKFAGSQQGTLHYRHLLPENGGFLRVAASMDEHVAQLSAVLRDPAAVRAELERFVGTFIRPQGLDVPSMPVLVDALERAALAPARAVQTSTLDRFARGVLSVLTLAAPLLWSSAGRKRQGRDRQAPGVLDEHQAARSSIASPRGRHRFALVLAAPMLAATLTVATFAGWRTAASTPFAYPPPENIAEAAGMGLAADVMRFLQRGEDPHGVFDVRPEVISSAVTRATGLEAAIWSRRVQMIRLLDRRGVIDDPGVRRHLSCLAADLRVDEIVDYFEPADCTAGEAAQLVESRSQ